MCFIIYLLSKLHLLKGPFQWVVVSPQKSRWRQKNLRQQSTQDLLRKVKSKNKKNFAVKKGALT